MASDRPLSPKETSRWRAAGHLWLVDLVFSGKTLIAALLAYYVALTIQLERPYWSVITCYIVAQPLTGALLSKGLFRLLGTAIGAVVAVLAVPHLVQAPELLVMVMVLWLGACSYIAALDRTPRSYVSLLAGYSAIIVAVPTVDSADAIFDVALSRVQEIGIGIICVSLVHALLFPKPVWHQMRDRLDSILADAGAWSNDALALPPRPDAMVWRDLRKLLGDLHDLHQLSTHLPYDMTSPAIAPAMLREAEMHLGLLLPLASAVEDRMAALLAQDGHDPRLEALIARVRGWIAAGAQEDPGPLFAGILALEPDLREAEGWPDLLRLSLLDRLAGLVQAHAAARDLRDRLVEQSIRAREEAGEDAGEDTGGAGRRALHRDHRMALRAAATTALAVTTACALWIATAWPEGGAAVVTCAIICALFSHLDAPMRAARRVFCGTVGSVVAAGICAFVLMPRVSDFETLCLIVAPFLLLLGWLLARAERVPIGVGAVLSFPGLAGLNVAYDNSFETFANQGLAQIVGAFLACLMLGAVRSTGARAGARRLVRAGWRELADKTQPRTTPQTSAWISRMLDRMVLLAPHLSALDHGDALARDHLRDIRIGMALDDLQRVGPGAGPLTARRNALLATRLRTHFLGAGKGEGSQADATLGRAIDRALAGANRLPSSPGKRDLLLALVGLRRNLSP